jgi:DNA-binding XRE family transcriptional regulator
MVAVARKLGGSLKGNRVGRKRAEPDDMSRYASKIAARVGDLREAAGMTGKEFAKKIKVPSSTYYSYEAGRIDIPLDLLPVIARVLRTTVADLMP